MSEHQHHGSWAVWLNDTDREPEGWTRLDVRPSNGAHVNEQHAEWLRQVIRGEADDRSEFVTAMLLHFTYQVAAFSNDRALVQRAAEFHYQFGRHIPTPRPGGCEHCKVAQS